MRLFAHTATANKIVFNESNVAKNDKGNNVVKSTISRNHLIMEIAPVTSGKAVSLPTCDLEAAWSVRPLVQC